MRHATLIVLAALASVSSSYPSAAEGVSADAAHAVRQGMRAARAMSDAVDAMPKGPCDDPVAATTCRDGRPVPGATAEGAWTDRHAPPPPHVTLDVADRGVAVTVAKETRGSSRSPGDTCLLAPRGTVEVIGTAPYLGTLVRHLPPSDASEAARSDCAAGTVAFVDWRAMRTWSAPSVARADREAVGPRLSEAADRLMAAAP